MRPKSTNLIIVGSAAAVCACVVWAAITISASLRESRPRGTELEPVKAAATSTGAVAPAAVPPPAPPPAPAMALSYDSFNRVFDGDLAARAEKECWSKAPPGSPDALHFQISIDAGGKPKTVKPEYPREEGDEARRAKLADQRALLDCVASVIRSATFSGMGPAEARVQANRPQR